MTNSRTKGKRGELEAAHAFETATGIRSRRGRQYSGSPDSPDVVSDSRVHLEVKRLARISALRALRQAERDADSSSIPVVLMREDGDTRWVAMVRLDRLREFMDELREAPRRSP
jgi:hypothetical protein